MKIRLALFAAILMAGFSCQDNDNSEILLNGEWQYGIDREYASTGQVPGIHTDPAQPIDGTLWYKRSVKLPEGDWNMAYLELNGARFCPVVYVDGEPVSRREGGMVRTIHELRSPSVHPGAEICLEIALSSLNDVPVTDASYIPGSDQWRSNCTSCLWDDVVLHLCRDSRVDRVLAFTDHDSGTLRLKYRVLGEGAEKALVEISRNGKALVELDGPAAAGESEVSLSYAGILEEWSPEVPNCYDLKVSLIGADGKVSDVFTQTLGLKDIRITGKQFQLNGQPFKVRGGSIVWHRWVRDPEGLELAWDTEWLERNIVRRLKDHGANLLRFHLGVPPERLLDLCDRNGLAVQYEWSFFHGMPASKESIEDQFPQWLDLASRHPSVCFYHPYNESPGTEIDTVWAALDGILPEYPALLMAERDITHVHKYWWSLFENLGLYYDSADQFDKAIVVDEFGGNYLDGNGDLGLYPTLNESTMRFLGPSHDASQRLHHLDRSCAKLGEYWRRIDAAGVAPFVIASSREDGNHWFLGALRDGNPKSVWDASTVVWSPQAVSMDIWDCDFTPSQKVSVPLHFINDCSEIAHMQAMTSIIDSLGNVLSETASEADVPAFGKMVSELELTMPDAEGSYLLRTELLNRPSGVRSPVRSDWDIRVLKAGMPSALKEKSVFIPSEEKELLAFAAQTGLRTVSEIDSAQIVLCGKASWPVSATLGVELEAATRRGCSVVMLDVGENVKEKTFGLFRSLSVTCRELPEPESHIHPPKDGSDALWKGYGSAITQLWNGLRGGLIVPSFDMVPYGMSADAFLRQWKSCGADEARIKAGGPYFAYNLCGYYAFADSPGDKAVEKELRRRVQFLIDDAPALSLVLNAQAPITVSNLVDGYSKASTGEATSLTPLACAGKNLTRIPVVRIDFNSGEGCVILSQLLTAGRLVSPDSEPVYTGSYDVRYDEAAVQVVLNMLAEAAESSE